MQKRDRMRTPQEQYELVMECRSSGLTDYQWCVKNGIKPGTFNGWVTRLKRNYNYEIPSRRNELKMQEQHYNLIHERTKKYYNGTINQEKNCDSFK